ncbi:GspE/PulE family protein [Desulfurobacterium atlanticum]|uniref:General secretion pathway protein E n=1 Tax=Desulfurobacterium atlanticum TaxID=240169 RepID=A0A238ZC04_9BACT|nr:GspE/PulE family protein [Desulfurobacterium atlanticum]SNR80609.1 general secretion pathway protein E [Desulfurobacterium atlanticum]
MRSEQIPVEFMRRNQILPCGDGKFYITRATPFYILEDLRLIYGEFETELIDEDAFNEKMEEYLSSIEGSVDEEGEIETSFSEDLLSGSDAPIIQMINSIFLKAIRVKASDIHFEPYEREVVVKFRLDGVLHEITRIPSKTYQKVVSRIKVISRLNVAEKRLPQDGRIRVNIGKKQIDMRVSTLPTVFGERVVIRLLDKSHKILTLEELGFSGKDYEIFSSVISKPYGLILVTGPTGSGKSTTLYAALLKIFSPTKNILTVEDPVEYQIEGINQVQVNPKIGLTFATGLRSILRQDPDIIMIGEIRDLETAEIAVRASMTGHLVLSTLHTNDAPSSIARLTDMGVEPFLIASSLECVVAQRLVRRVCSECSYPYTPSEKERELIEKVLKRKAPEKLIKGKGCEKCLGTGYSGRIGIYQLMRVDEEMKSLITRTSETDRIRKLAFDKGMKTLLHDGLEKVVSGITTIEEVLQVAGR